MPDGQSGGRRNAPSYFFLKSGDGLGDKVRLPKFLARGRHRERAAARRHVVSAVGGPMIAFDFWARNSGCGCKIHDCRRVRSADIRRSSGIGNPSAYYPNLCWLLRTMRLYRRTGHAPVRGRSRAFQKQRQLRESDVSCFNLQHRRNDHFQLD